MEVVVEASMGAIYRSINGGAMDFRHHNDFIAFVRSFVPVIYGRQGADLIDAS